MNVSAPVASAARIVDMNITVHLVPTPAAAPPGFVQDYGFWVNVSLTVASLAVTCVAVVIAVSAFVGYQGVQKLAKKQSEKHAKGAVEAFLKSAAFKNLLKAAAEDAGQEKIKDKVLVVPPEGGVQNPDGQGLVELN